MVKMDNGGFVGSFGGSDAPCCQARLVKMKIEGSILSEGVPRPYVGELA